MRELGSHVPLTLYTAHIPDSLYFKPYISIVTKLLNLPGTKRSSVNHMEATNKFHGAEPPLALVYSSSDV
jgi:hypothetical protein